MSEDAFETLLTFRVCYSLDSILSEKTEKIVLDSRDFKTRAAWVAFDTWESRIDYFTIFYQRIVKSINALCTESILNQF